MIWETIAEGTKLETLEVVRQRRLAKGTRVRFHMTVRTPLGLPMARAFDLPGAEPIFRRVMPEGLELVDVHSPDNHEQVVIDARVTSNPIVTTTAILLFVKANWLKLSLVTIGIVFALGALITAIRIDAEMIPYVWGITLVAIVLIAVVFIVAKAGLKTPKFSVGR
ncbi:MAG: hypothetical protein DDT33_01557 [Firmicutes bacterium]|nr:hypothetical protein [Bacillota bacterium]